MNTLDIENKLYNWTKTRGFWRSNTRFQRINYDSVYVTKEEYFQSDICVEVPTGTLPSEDISIMETPQRLLASLKVNYTASKDLLLEPLGDLNSWILSSGYNYAKLCPSIIYHKKRTIKNIKDRYKELLDFEICFPVVCK